MIIWVLNACRDDGDDSDVELKYRFALTSLWQGILKDNTAAINHNRRPLHHKQCCFQSRTDWVFNNQQLSGNIWTHETPKHASVSPIIPDA